MAVKMLSILLVTCILAIGLPYSSATPVAAAPQLYSTLPAGSLDPTFWTAGFNFVPPPEGFSTYQPPSMGVQPNGMIVVGAQVTDVDGATRHYALIRFRPTGALDTTFGVAGILLLDMSVNGFINDFTVLPNGKMLLVGSFPKSQGSVNMLLRLNANGTIDKTFGTEGRATLDLEESMFSTAVTFQPDGKIITAGILDAEEPQPDIDDLGIFAARFLTDGNPDPTFSDDGVAFEMLRSSNDESVINAYDVSVSPDGHILVGGREGNEVSGSPYLLHLNPDGSPAASLSMIGVFPAGCECYHGADDVLLQPDNKPVMITTVIAAEEGSDEILIETANSFGVARWNPDGSLDPTFDQDGMVSFNFPGSTWDNPLEMLRQPDGKLVIAGGANSKSEVALARLNTDGSLDSSFGQGLGLVHSELSASAEYATAVRLDGRGRILVAGISGRRIFVARYFGKETVIPPGVHWAGMLGRESFVLQPGQVLAARFWLTDPYGDRLTQRQPVYVTLHGPQHGALKGPEIARWRPGRGVRYLNFNRQTDSYVVFISTKIVPKLRNGATYTLVVRDIETRAILGMRRFQVAGR